MSTALESPTNPGLNPPEPQPNTVAVIGAVLTGISVALCGLLFYWVSLLPVTIEGVAALESDAPEQLRILILSGATGVLSLVAWCLCVVGLVIPGRTRFLAAVASLISTCVLFGLFGVVFLGALLNPAVPAPPDPRSATESTDSAAESAAADAADADAERATNSGADAGPAGAAPASSDSGDTGPAAAGG